MYESRLILKILSVFVVVLQICVYAMNRVPGSFLFRMEQALHYVCVNPNMYGKNSKRT